MKARLKQKRGILAIAGATAGVAVLAKILLGHFKGGSNETIDGIHVRFNYSPSEILKQANEVIAMSKRVYDQVATVPLDEVSYERVIAPLVNLETEEFPLVQSCVFPRLVAVSKDVRDASAEAEMRIDAHNIKCSMREDVYRVVKAFADKDEPLGSEAQRYVDRLVRDFERLGLNLSKEKRNELEMLNTKIGEFCLLFHQNVNEENQLLYFSEAELAGVPTDFLKELKRSKDGKLEVSLKYHHYFPVMERCKIGATRKALGIAHDQRCIRENVPILQKVLSLRHTVAQILGYENHAEYETAVRMAKSPEKVKDFLEGISARMSVLARKELRRLREMKMEEEGSETFSMYDLRYYINKAEEAEFKVDFEQVKQYFPIEVVTQGLLKIYQDLLGLRFKEVHRPQVWHQEVQQYAVFDAETGERMGFFYLDLFPRSGKYAHTCVCSLQTGCVQSDGTRQLPVAALLANFTRPTREKPSLLNHGEVVRYFHEFGHVMHHICSRPSFAKFTGLRVEDDFVEAPSQMLENWCFESSALKLMSGYYKDTRLPIPNDICEALVRKRRSFAGILTKRQLLFGLYDQAIHTSPSVDTASILKKLHLEVMEGIPMAEGTNFGASFSHIVGGYDGSYYGYLWSEVFSADMFASKFKWNVLSRATGREYREKVLKPGACKDGFDLLEDFLEREPSEEAFLRSKGVL
ncbi:hypothetical protein R1flu_014150 [Riccia fluitans]|uniref:Peptidase M3A/M3B catalytic domain-containing protein n=1 Tax=Riccia fluitans TaxID=41844 RepID=A0ABD1YF99_9MARC